MLVRERQIKNARLVRGGYTLMEMLVVVAIIVVLAGAGGVIYMRNLEDAKKSTARSKCKLLAQQVAAYQLKNGDYPASLQALTQRTADGESTLGRRIRQ